MKQLLTLLAIVFLTSCATGGLYKGYILDTSDDFLLTSIPDKSNHPIVSKDSSIPDDYIFIRFNLLNNENSFLEAYISPRTFERRPFIVGGVGNSYWIQSAINIYAVCEKYSGDVCLLDEFDDKKYLEEALAFTCVELSKLSIKRFNQYSKMREKIPNASRCIPFIQEEENKKMIAAAKKKEDEEQKRLAVLYALNERCIEYGFTGNNNIAACIQREAQHDFEIEQQKYQVELLKQQLASQTNQTNTTEKIPFWMEILGAVAEGVAEGYKQQQLINTLDNRYQKKSIYRYQPSCVNGSAYDC